MCGINGFNFKDKSLIVKMKEFTKMRGPDADGIYLDESFSVSHDRLSIIDLQSSANNLLDFDNIQNLLTKHKNEYHNPALIWSLIDLQLFFRKFRI